MSTIERKVAQFSSSACLNFHLRLDGWLAAVCHSMLLLELLCRRLVQRLKRVPYASTGFCGSLNLNTVVGTQTHTQRENHTHNYSTQICQCSVLRVKQFNRVNSKVTKKPQNENPYVAYVYALCTLTPSRPMFACNFSNTKITRKKPQIREFHRVLCATQYM